MDIIKLDFIGSDEEQNFRAVTPFVDYEVFRGMGGWCAELKLGRATIILSRKLGVTKELAMQICQSDFECRVKKSILPEKERSYSMPEQPTMAQAQSICLSYRHDYGLLPVNQQKRVAAEGTQWWEAIAKEINESSNRTKV